MSTRYASGKKSIAECDICSFRYPLHKLKPLTVKTKNTNILACPSCWNPDHPQLMLGMYPVDDPQAVRNPRPDNSYWQSGNTGLQIDIYGDYNPISVNSYGTPNEGSRVIQWGWNPVGLHNQLGLFDNQDWLKAVGEVGDVTIICNGGTISVDVDVSGEVASTSVGDVSVVIGVGFSVLSSSGTPLSTSHEVLNSSSATFSVSQYVLDSAGNSFTVI